jgi:4-alpha-glucanotransferase
MSTIRGWWEEDRQVTQKFYHQELQKPGDAPPHCETWINQAVVQQHLASPAMWSIFQLQDLLGSDEALRRKDVDAERINVPANPKNYWRYRMHLTLEKLLQAEEFNVGVNKSIRENGR